MSYMRVQFYNGDVVDVSHAGHRYSRVDHGENRIDVSMDGITWTQLYPTNYPDYDDAEDGDGCDHIFEDHPDVCSECGECVERGLDVDYWND